MYHREEELSEWRPTAKVAFACLFRVSQDTTVFFFLSFSRPSEGKAATTTTAYCPTRAPSLPLSLFLARPLSHVLVHPDPVFLPKDLSFWPPSVRAGGPDLQTSGAGLGGDRSETWRSMSAQGTREFFSATSNVPFRTEQELHEHYRSAFHRYNLKRRVAGLGPVTREWFDTHRDKLSLGRSRQGDGFEGNQDCTTVYYDPLSKKQFNTEAKYNEFVNSNKYKVSITVYNNNEANSLLPGGVLLFSTLVEEEGDT